MSENNIEVTETVEMIENKEDGEQKFTYPVLVTGIKWNPDTCRTYRVKHDSEVELPEQFTLDIPEGLYNKAVKAEKKAKSETEFKDIIETHVYDFLTHKFNHEVYSCSIWLPLKDEDQV